jgi:hypothetical protein
MFSFPAALILGIVGIVCDRPKWLAITTTVVAGGLMLVFICMMAIAVMGMSTIGR